jgi:hypothetical protein
MARSQHDYRSTAIPEADWLEQEQPANPTVGDEQVWPAAASTQDADDADRLEQSQVVVGDPDEEYTPDPP